MNEIDLKKNTIKRQVTLLHFKIRNIVIFRQCVTVARPNLELQL